MRELSERALKDIVDGAAFLGTGGGGSIESGKKLVEEQLDDVEVVTVDEVEDDSDVVVVAGMGAPEALLEKGWGSESINAFEALEEVTNIDFDYVIPVEIGAFNSLTPMTVTMEKGVPTIDADGAGRAIPELQQTMYSIHGISVSPTALADNEDFWGVLNTSDPFKMEDLARAITSELGDQAGIALHVMKGKEMKEVVIEDTLLLSENVGKAIRESKEAQKDPVQAVIEEVDGYELFQGEVTEKTTETKKGFDFGKVTIEGTENYEGDTFVMDYKNENMIGKLNGEIVCMVPDRMCWITTEGDPLTNVDVKEGLEVAVIGIKAPDIWRTEKGFEAFKRVLEALDYEGEYQPIEKLIE